MMWRPFRRRRSRDDRLDDELRYHVDRQYDDYLRAGLSPAEARRRVGLEFGSIELAKDECQDIRPWHWLGTTARDVRLGLRGLARERSFTLSVTLILTTGIGATVAMFSVLYGVVLRPLPYSQPHELAMIATHRMLQNQFEGTSGANFVDWRRQSRSFARMSLYRRSSASQVVFESGNGPQRTQEGLVDADFFGLLGATALVGRTFSADESARGDRVVVLSEIFWRDAFGGSIDVIGRTMLVSGAPHTIVGVMSRRFQMPTKETRLWRPLAVMPRWPAQLAIRDADQFEVLGRLQPGISIREAQAEMQVIARRLREDHDVNRNLDIRVTPLLDHIVGESARRGIYLGFAAVLSLLAIAGANAGGLLATRAMRRRGELAIRTALGASRARLIRQLMTEHVALWLAVSAAGLVVAAILLRLLESSGLNGLPRLDNIDLDMASVAIAFLGGLLIVTTCGSVPALAASRTDAGDVFRTRGSDGPSHQRLQRGLVTTQIAGATMLAVVAGLLVQSFVRVQRQDPGYPASNLLAWGERNRQAAGRWQFATRRRPLGDGHRRCRRFAT